MQMQDNNRERAALDVIAKPPLIFLVSILLSLVLHFIWPLSFSNASIIILFGGALVLGCFILMYLALKAFDEAQTAVNPDISPSDLVQTGPYRYTRNPMYVAFILLQSGLGMLMGSFWFFLLLVPTLFVLIKGVIEREEAYMAQKFGQEYLEYKQSVRRWL